MVFTRSEDTDVVIANLLSSIGNSLENRSVQDAILAVATGLDSILADGSANAPLMIDSNDEDDQDAKDDELYHGLDESDDDFTEVAPTRRLPSKVNQAVLKKRIASDLGQLRTSGFRFSALHGMQPQSESSILSISMRVHKLGLSDEALTAWDLEPQQYIVLLIRYNSIYTPLEAVLASAAKHSGIDFRIGVSDRPNPNLQHALGAFAARKNAGHGVDETKKAVEFADIEATFSPIFISGSLEQLLAEEFVSLLHLRCKNKIGWDDAKSMFEQSKGRVAGAEPSYDKPEAVSETQGQSRFMPAILLADHLEEQPTEPSLPLTAAQFAFRYLIRCTEFCLVCHEKVKSDFEALKPYVCENPLCLYQYMSLGFGPSIEQELMTQPYVVDLLVNFCYTSALVSEIILSCSRHV